MTDRERKLASLGFEYAEGIERASVITIPSTGREVRKVGENCWESQPPTDNYWRRFRSVVAAIRFATPAHLLPK